MRAYLRHRFREIHHALKDAKEIHSAQPEAEQFLAGYLVVFISGVFEDCIERLFIERARLTEDEHLASFVEETMNKSFRNPTCENIKAFLGRLDRRHKDRLDRKVAGFYQDGLDAIVNNKNALAHGRSANATLREVIDYYFRARRVFQGLEDILF